MPDSPADFPETRWSLVQSARSEEMGLAEWCECYSSPVRAYFMSLGCTADQADDFTQDFFVRLLNRGPDQSLPAEARGSFRAYLKRSLRNFLIDQRRAEKAARRGGGTQALNIDDLALEGGNNAPDQDFDRSWIMRVIELATNRLQAEFAKGDRKEFFDAVAPALDGRQADSSLASKFGMSEAAFRAAVYRMRKRFRQLIEDELRETVSTAEGFETEIRHLFELWS